MQSTPERTAVSTITASSKSEISAEIALRMSSAVVSSRPNSAQSFVRTSRVALSLSQYSCMYNAPRAEVELLCDNSVMDAIIDRFGPDVQTYAGDLQNFRVIEEIAVGKVFFNWIFGFEGKVRIKGPESVKKQYREMVMSAMNLV